MMKTGLLLKWFLVLFLGFGVVTTMAYYANPGYSIFQYPQSIYEYFFKWPKAPEIVDQQLEGGCGTRIFWADNELNEDGVYFYRRVVGEANFTAVKIRPPHAGVPGSFDDGNLPIGTYEYRVSVFNEYHESFSNISEQLTIDNEVCGNEPILIKPLNPVITGLERVKGTTCTVRIYFNDNSLDEDGIRVYRSSWVDSDVLLAELPPNNGPTGSYDDTTLSPGHYTYQVSAFNENGESFSTLSDEIEITEESCNPSAANPPAILVITPNPILLSTVTPTPVAEAQACIWKAVINVFVRTGPGASLYPEITAVESGIEFPVVGQSEDGQFWVVELRPETFGYVPKAEKFSQTSGDCNPAPTLQDPQPPPSPVPTKEQPVAGTPQCSDGADNDGDKLVDMRDGGCSSPNDDSE